MTSPSPPRLAHALAAALTLGLLGLLAGCPRFHAGPLPGAPADATFVDVDGVHVRYRASGAGPAVVMIHGYSASSASWLPVIPSLEPRHRVIAIDLKGFGWTSRPAGDYSPAAQAALVWKVLDKLGVADVAIVGHSWGSSVVLSMAVTQPARVRRVALYDAYVYDDQVPSFFGWAEQPGLGELLFGLYYRERIEDRGPLAYHDERWVTQARVEYLEAELDRPGTVAAALATARKHQFATLHEQLKAFTRPVLLLWGEQDQVTPLRFGQRLANELANAELKVYPLCGHAPMIEAHGPSTRDLARFLARDVGAATASTASPATGTGTGTETETETETETGTESDTDTDTGTESESESDTGTGSGTGSGSGSGSATPAARDLATATEDGITIVRIAELPGDRRPVPSLTRDLTLPVGADLAAIGAELTPRRYAAPREGLELVLHGGLRVRETGLYNLDLDRGLDSRGQPIYPVPLGGGQLLDAGDLRARTDLTVHAAGVGVAVKARIDWLDNVSLGGDPDLANGSPATSTGQRPTAVVVKRVWGEALTPFGILAAGRMGAHFGLGITANGGDCDDCDKGDAADRVAFVSPLAGHLVAAAYDVAARGPFTRSRDAGHAVALEPSDQVAGFTLAVLKVHSPAALGRRAEAGRTSVEYGAYVGRRTQDDDVPASYLPTATPPTMFTSDDLVARGFSATATGGWFRITNAHVRLEAEATYARARIEQPSLIPGTEITVPVTSSQLGIAMQSELLLGRSRLGFDAGYASGDDAPGFGAFPVVGEAAPMAGAFDGAQANLPRDRTVDNFRFHPDYRIDQILFREIIGTVTDAIYLRPHARTTLLTAGAGRLEAAAALIASWAVEASSTPSGARGLGIELDPELR
ncbi:MAG: alpha/beta fold hydrolase, partial [Deltaproteobacteria bacterium]|nr:alpha/beta fold hydrolase [Deltaproteobacteria bacterium]